MVGLLRSITVATAGWESRENHKFNVEISLFRDFYWGHEWLNHCLLVTEFNFQSLYPPWGWRWPESSNPLITCLATGPHSAVSEHPPPFLQSMSHLIGIQRTSMGQRHIYFLLYQGIYTRKEVFLLKNISLIHRIIWETFNE